MKTHSTAAKTNTSGPRASRRKVVTQRGSVVVAPRSAKTSIFSSVTLMNVVLPGVAATTLRQAGSEIVSRVASKGQVVAITRSGKAVAVMVPLATYEIFRELENASDLASARAACEESRGEKHLTVAEAQARLGP